MIPNLPRRPLTWLALALSLTLALTLASLGSAATSYGYVRTLDGRANHVPADGSEVQALETGQPLLTGDRIEVASDSRAEIVLADQTVLRLDSTSAVSLDALADSGDRDAPASRLGLAHGNVQVVVADGATQPPRIDTSNASVYFLAPGSYRVSTEDDWTVVVVRDGSAEVRTPGDVRQIDANQAVEVRGDVSAPRLAERDPGPEDVLERWGRRLEERAAGARLDDVDPSLRYAAAPLEGHGSWVDVNGQRAWQPWVGSDWRPYSDGGWDYTPSGLTWVSGEPWGWVTYHYGSWDLAPGFGWVWYPGATYAPAWVYWYWGPSYVGWCPIGYYTRFYSLGLGFDLGFHFGIHGWAGGHWDGFRDWNFVPIDHIRDRHLRRWAQPGHQLRDTRPGGVLPRGVITTDTRAVTRERWARPREIATDLERTAIANPRTRLAGTGALPDLNGFVARRKDITSDLRQIAMPVGSGNSAGRTVEQRSAQPRAFGSAPGNVTPGWKNEGGGVPPSRVYRDSAPRVGVTDGNWRGGGRVIEPRGGGSAPDLRAVRPREGVALPSSPSGGGSAIRDWRAVRPQGITPRVTEPTQPGGTGSAIRDWRAVRPQGLAPRVTEPTQPGGTGSTIRDWRAVRPQGLAPRVAEPTPRTVAPQYRYRPLNEPAPRTTTSPTPIRRIVDSIRRPGGESGVYRQVTPPAPRSYSPGSPSGGSPRVSSGGAGGSHGSGSHSSGGASHSAPPRSSSHGEGHKPPRH